MALNRTPIVFKKKSIKVKPLVMKKQASNPIGTIINNNNDGSKMYITTWSKLSKYNIENWEFNRPPDMTRIPDIEKHMKLHDYIDGTIYMFKSDENTLVCFDGIHRIKALQQLHNISNENTFDHKIIIHLYDVYNKEQIKNKFEILNKTIPLPEIYTKAHRELDTKNKVENIVKHFTEKYPNMFRPSKTPHAPHENRDRFNDRVYDILMNELQIIEFNESKLIRLFEEFNTTLKERKEHLRISKKQLDKCITNDCFVFAPKNWHNLFIKYFINNEIVLRRNALT